MHESAAPGCEEDVQMGIAILIGLAVLALVILYLKDKKKNGVTMEQETAELLEKAKSEGVAVEAAIVTEAKTIQTDATGDVKSITTTTVTEAKKLV